MIDDFIIKLFSDKKNYPFTKDSTIDYFYYGSIIKTLEELYDINIPSPNIDGRTLRHFIENVKHIIKTT